MLLRYFNKITVFIVNCVNLYRNFGTTLIKFILCRLKQKVMPAKLSKPNSYYIRGRDLVLNQYTEPPKIGMIPMFLHQTWKSELMKQDYVNLFDNWTKMHPGFVHVLWTDEDNELLVATCFPELMPSYSWLPLIIQKTDFVRLMYLYRYGGIYIDLDYRCYQPIPPCLPQLCGFMAVESPFTLNECMQNSLMVSVPEHPVVLEALNIINQSIIDLRQRVKYKNLNFKNKLIGPILATFFTLSLTGPQVLDKAVTRVHAAQSQEEALNTENVHPAARTNLNSETAKRLSVVKLNESFFKGPVAAHLQHSTWMESLPQKCMPIILIAVFTLILLLTVTVLITFFVAKRKSL